MDLSDSEIGDHDTKMSMEFLLHLNLQVLPKICKDQHMMWLKPKKVGKQGKATNKLDCGCRGWIKIALAEDEHVIGKHGEIRKFKFQPCKQGKKTALGGATLASLAPCPAACSLQNSSVSCTGSVSIKSQNNSKH